MMAMTTVIVIKVLYGKRLFRWKIQGRIVRDHSIAIPRTVYQSIYSNLSKFMHELRIVGWIEWLIHYKTYVIEKRQLGGEDTLGVLL